LGPALNSESIDRYCESPGILPSPSSSILLPIPHISVAGSEEDVNLVQKLVDFYLQHSWTIIIAIIPGTSGVDTQGII
jgi:hypothetical protein